MSEEEFEKLIKEIEEAGLKAKKEWNALSQEERDRLTKEADNSRFWEDLSDYDGWKVTPPSK